ncbi:hypothetical protein PIB30_073379 [Stylosanthes scabra]|uniref:Uncharacterized protein n=1 Tax=Stylosanthes scabra TaxID=79078 RepID=A0ABU6TP13_9FABA|nr:hypothetical protein [Stylosanthes scabra]
MPKRQHVPTDPREEIPVSKSAPPVGNATESSSQPQAAPTFVIPVPPPMPKTLQPLRAKQKIFRPPASFGDVHFSTRPAQPPIHPIQPPFPPQQNAPIPQGPPPSLPRTSNQEILSQETMAAARGTTAERLFEFMPTPNFKPPN